MDADCARLGVANVQRAAGEKIQELLKRSRRRLANMAETSMRAERRGRVVRGVAAVALLVCGACWAQSDEQLDLLGGLRHGNLVVWMVRAPSGRAPRVPGTPLYRSPTPGFSQSTTGSFGQSASSVGTNAGDYGVDSSSATISAPSSPTVARRDPSANTADGSGYKEQTSGSYGQTSSSYGTAASNHGQTASSLGQNASTAGQTASSYGQTAGSFGNSLSTIAQAGVKEKTAQSNEVDPLRDELRARLQSSFPQLTVTTREVPADFEETGSFIADETSDIAPPVAGRVIATPVNIGDHVREGQVICELDHRDAELKLEQARAQFAESTASVRQARSRIGLGTGIPLSYFRTGNCFAQVA